MSDCAPKNLCCWFEIPVTDLSKSIEFYNYVLETEITEQPFGEGDCQMMMGFFPMGDEGYGAAGALIKNDYMQPSDKGTLVYMSTSDIEAALARANEKGGQTIAPKMAIGEHGFIGIFSDLDGNRVGVHCMS